MLNKIYYQKNKTRLLAKQRAYNRKNKKEIRAKARTYYWKNRKKCRARCQEYQRKNKEKCREYKRKNKEKCREYNRKWRKENPGRLRFLRQRWEKENPKSVRSMRLKQHYGITLKEFEVFRSAQKNRCRICKKKFDKTPSVDHSHKSGSVRGLLCGKCNVGLGMFQDSVENLTSAVRYLKETER